MNGGCSTTPFSCTFCRSRLIFINKVHGLVSQKKKKLNGNISKKFLQISSLNLYVCG